MIDYSQILLNNYPNTQWVISGSSYDDIDWHDETAKPTKAELEALWDATQDIQAKNICKEKAKKLLAATDYVLLTDVPLDNKADYKTYRAVLRDLVLNPVVDPVFPDEPVPVWK